MLMIVAYRFKYSGIRKGHIENARSLTEVKDDLLPILKNSIIVGHDVIKEKEALKFTHEDIMAFNLKFRCTANRNLKVRQRNGRLSHCKPSLHSLFASLPYDITKTMKFRKGGLHCSVEDAKATMAVFLHLTLKQPLPGVQKHNTW